MEQITKENPAANGAHSKRFDTSKNSKEQKNEQHQNDFTIEITVHSGDPEAPANVFVLHGKPAKSLWYLYQYQTGLTRAEALDKHFILSLTQHVHYFRSELDLDILTERIPPTRYANYHLITPVSIRILSQGGL